VAEQDLKAFLDALAHDTALQEKLNDTKDLDAALAVAKEAGFEISKADWLLYQSKLITELSDEELEGVTGGTSILFSPPDMLKKRYDNP